MAVWKRGSRDRDESKETGHEAIMIVKREMVVASPNLVIAEARRWEVIGLTTYILIRPDGILLWIKCEAMRDNVVSI